jgi:hypothetical protein
MLLGFTNPEIAEYIGLTPNQVSQIRNSPLVRAKLEILHAKRDEQAVELAKELQEEAVRSFSLLTAVRDGKVMDAEGNAISVNIGLRANVAFGLMDRAGYAPIKRIQGEILHGHLTMEEIEEIKTRARKAKCLEVPAEIIQQECSA